MDVDTIAILAGGAVSVAMLVLLGVFGRRLTGKSDR